MDLGGARQRRDRWRVSEGEPALEGAIEAEFDWPPSSRGPGMDLGGARQRRDRWRVSEGEPALEGAIEAESDWPLKWWGRNKKGRTRRPSKTRD